MNNQPQNTSGSGVADALNFTESPIKGWGEVRSSEMQYLLANIKEQSNYLAAEKAAQQEIFKSLSESNKFDLLPPDQIRFRKLYEKEKSKIEKKMGQYESTQGYLNNGGYEELMNFRNSVLGSQELSKAILNKSEMELIYKSINEGKQDAMRTKDGYELSEKLDLFNKGLVDRIEYQGHYNWQGIDPRWFPTRKDESSTERTDYTPMEYVQVLEANGVPHQKKQQLVEQYIQQYQSGNGIPKILPDLQAISARGANNAQQKMYENQMIDWKNVINTANSTYENYTFDVPANGFGKPGTTINAKIERKWIPEVMDRVAKSKGIKTVKSEDGQEIYTLNSSLDLRPIGQADILPQEMLMMINGAVAMPTNFIKTPVVDKRTGTLMSSGERLATGQPKASMFDGVTVSIPMVDDNMKSAFFDYAKKNGLSKMANQIDQGYVELWMEANLDLNTGLRGNMAMGSSADQPWKGNLSSNNTMDARAIQNQPVFE